MTTASSHQEPQACGLWPTLGWACFLGCSWTWVIGMVWPAMLVRDYGPWGWVAFALPNVLGAAAMGVVLARPGRSRAFVQCHGAMAEQFSLCTVGFHMFVLGWLMPSLFGPLIVPITLVAAVVVWTRVRRTGSALSMARMVCLFSIVFLGVGLSVGASDAWTGVWKPAVDGERFGVDSLWWIVPGMVVGFGLCPYLDLTFHRARQAMAPRSGMAAFGVGFGVVFLLMILGSLAYGALLWPALRGEPSHLSGIWGSVLAVHLTLQIAFTTALHSRELIHRSGGRAVPRLVLVGLTALILGGLMNGSTPIGFGSHAGPHAISTRTSAEVGYRLFLLAYALIFPAYVWLCAIPTLRAVSAVRRRICCFIAVILTLPMAYAVVVLGKNQWALPVLGILVIARLVLELMGTGPAFPRRVVRG